MNFERLSSDLAANVMGKCRFQAIAKLMQTNTKINKFIRKNKLDKIDVNHIGLVHNIAERKVHLMISDCPMLGQFNFFEKFYNIALSDESSEQKNAGLGIISKVLSSIKTVKFIRFRSFVIDESFIQLLKTYQIDWKHASLDFHLCRYDIPKTDLLPFWQMFGTVVSTKAQYKESFEDIWTDEMMSQCLPNITLNTLSARNISNLTDKTLETLVKTRPPNFLLNNCMTSYTFEGVVSLFTTIVENREPSIKYWVIGRVRMDFYTLLREVENLQEKFKEFANILVVPTSSTPSAKCIWVEYTKKGTDDAGIVAVEVVQ